MSSRHNPLGAPWDGVMIDLADPFSFLSLVHFSLDIPFVLYAVILASVFLFSILPACTRQPSLVSLSLFLHLWEVRMSSILKTGLNASRLSGGYTRFTHFLFFFLMSLMSVFCVEQDWPDHLPAQQRSSCPQLTLTVSWTKWKAATAKHILHPACCIVFPALRRRARTERGSRMGGKVALPVADDSEECGSPLADTPALHASFRLPSRLRASLGVDW